VHDLVARICRREKFATIELAQPWFLVSGEWGVASFRSRKCLSWEVLQRNGIRGALAPQSDHSFGSCPWMASKLAGSREAGRRRERRGGRLLSRFTHAAVGAGTIKTAYIGYVDERADFANAKPRAPQKVMPLARRLRLANKPPDVEVRGAAGRLPTHSTICALFG
jgi:hypothetical protein